MSYILSYAKEGNQLEQINITFLISQIEVRFARVEPNTMEGSFSNVALHQQRAFASGHLQAPDMRKTERNSFAGNLGSERRGPPRNGHSIKPSGAHSDTELGSANDDATDTDTDSDDEECWEGGNSFNI